MRRIAFFWLSLILVLAGHAAIANAHPLGNFTINHLAKIGSSANALKIRYVLDIAEIPTFQIMNEHALRDRWTNASLHTWGANEIDIVSNGLTVSVDGVRSPMHAVTHHERLRPGAGGLPTLYWTGEFTIPLSAGTHHVTVEDGVYAERRIGWKDIVVAPQTEPTHELLSYPNALLGSPRHVSAASFDIAPNGRAINLSSEFRVQPNRNGAASIVRVNALSEMFSRTDRTPFFVILTIITAFGLGALHALEPGHGKALLAFTLVGSRATVKQAAILAASLTFAHTIGVLILGIVLFFGASFASESIYPWITLISGAAVAAIGARNLSRYLHARQRYADEGRAHVHGFTSDHHHGSREPVHSHTIPGTGPIDFRGAIVAATSGGIAPCPAAIVVMLAALRLHQIGYGIVLIVVFSLGLAFVLTGLGVAIVRGSMLIARNAKFDRLVSSGPLLSAALISIVGAVMIGEGFVAQGVGAPVWLLASLVVAAIAGYGVAPQHVHLHGHASEGQTV